MPVVREVPKVDDAELHRSGPGGPLEHAFAEESLEHAREDRDDVNLEVPLHGRESLDHFQHCARPFRAATVLRISRIAPTV
jgi:hypothetical protein